MTVFRWTFSLKDSQVRSVHRQNIVKKLEILFIYHTSTQCFCVITPSTRRSLRPFIRRLADVVIMCTGRIDVDFVLHPSHDDLVPKNGLSGGRAADVAHANEQNISPGALSPVHHIQLYLSLTSRLGHFHSYSLLATSFRTIQQIISMWRKEDFPSFDEAVPHPV